jgi:xylose isomerase
LEDVGYQGSRHFDAHAYRTEDYEGVTDFARGCMRSYLILKEKAARWAADEDIRDILDEVGRRVDGLPCTSCYSSKGADALLGHAFDKDAILKKRLPYERLDQLTVDVLAGVR